MFDDILEGGLFCFGDNIEGSIIDKEGWSELVRGSASTGY